MTDSTALRRRIVRRETHSPRSALAIGTAILLALVCAYAVAEFLLHFLGQPPLVVAPADMLTALVGLPAAVAVPLLVLAGSVLALIGLILIVAALAPGRLARHVLDTERAATVVDNEVIASALARTAARVANISPDSVRATVSHTKAEVRVTPSTGLPIDPHAVSEAIDDQLAASPLRPRLRARVVIERHGKVGA
jgi:hypothetical protein